MLGNGVAAVDCGCLTVQVDAWLWSRMLNISGKGGFVVFRECRITEWVMSKWEVGKKVEVREH